MRTTVFINDEFNQRTIMEIINALAVGTLFALGIFQFLRRNLIRSIIGVILLGNAVNLFLLASGAYNGLVPAYTTEIGTRSDALPQALILTAIVISMGGMAFVLSMLYIISGRYQTSDMDEVSHLKH
ncbi:MAG: NADH-quinone oxidoreductase subunit K [Anaerolineales bacterium]|nr:NADH-quinone oxidoreductase subunit K [Anaerolineales bacterium]